MKKKNLEEIALNYLDSSNPTFLVDEKLLRILAEKVVPLVEGPLVLEMGFGENAWTKRVIAKFGKTHIVDGSRILLDSAKEEYGDKVIPFQAFFEDFNPGIAFDSILATMILEHVDDPQQVLKQIKTYAKSTSQVMIMVPNANSLHRLYGTSLGLLQAPTDLSESDIQLGHKRVYTAAELEKDIQASGLIIKQRLPTYVKFLSNSQMKDFSDSQLRALFALADKISLDNSAHLFYECSPA